MTAVESGVGLRVEPATPQIGAFISGVDLRDEVTEGQKQALEDELEKHLVLFFRGQTVDPSAQVRLVELFAPATGTHLAESLESDPRILVIDQMPDGKRNQNNYWHSD